MRTFAPRVKIGISEVYPGVKTEPYLESTDVIDWKTKAVCGLAREPNSTYGQPIEIARACFEWVRDKIGHSGDIQSEVVTCSASEVLKEKTDWCFAKSHLPAALLRATNRLRRDDSTGFTLHGLNTVFLPKVGWYRVDARGNKPGIDAQFIPPIEQLAWPIFEPGEMDSPEVWSEPLPIM